MDKHERELYAIAEIILDDFSKNVGLSRNKKGHQMMTLDPMKILIDFIVYTLKQIFQYFYPLYKAINPFY